jgi:hypothetical protein
MFGMEFLQTCGRVVGPIVSRTEAKLRSGDGAHGWLESPDSSIIIVAKMGFDKNYKNCITY